MFFINCNCVETKLYAEVENTFSANQLIETSLKSCESKVFWMEGIELETAPLIINFYKENNFVPVWTNGNIITRQTEELLSLLKDAYKFGLDPDNFNIAELENYIESLKNVKGAKKSARIRASFDFLMSNSVFLFMVEISKGTDYSIKSDLTDNDYQNIAKFPVYLKSKLN
jgi:hypothetical protein